MVHNQKLVRRSSGKYQTFSESPSRSDLFPLCRYRCILSKYCRLHVENREIFGPYDFSAPVKIFQTEAVATFLVEKLKCESHDPSGPRSGYAPADTNKT